MTTRAFRFALTLALCASAGGCALLEAQAPALDSAATEAMQIGGCVRIVARPAEAACNTALWSDVPLQNCRPRPGRCHR